MNSDGLKTTSAPVFSSQVRAPSAQLKRNLVLSVLLAAATVAVYFPVHHHPFLNLDDNQYVTDNIDVQGGLNWDTVRWAFTTYYSLNWHPVTWLSHAVDIQIFGLNPAGHHDVNLLLHVLNVLLLFWILERATGYAGRSAMVAALFALHPINVETVAWIAERKSLLSMFFSLVALGTYHWYTRRPGIARYGLVALWFALALMAKPQAITLPFVLLLWDYWPLGRMRTDDLPQSLWHGKDRLRIRVAAPSLSGMDLDTASDAAAEPQSWREFSWLLVEKLPLLVLCVASSLLTLAAQRAGGAVVSLNEYSLPVRLENALVSYVKYLGKAFWPTNLSLMYPHPGNAIKAGWALAALFLLIAITAVVWKARRRRYLLVGWLWFLGTMVPMIGIVQVGHQAMADRYAYLPFIGLFIMICWGVADLVAVAVPTAAESATASPKMRLRRFIPGSLDAASIVVLMALAIVTRHQLAYWSDNLALWSRVTQVIGTNSIAEERMGDELMKRKQPEAAMHRFARAAALDPKDPLSNFALAVYEQKQHDLTDAIRRYKIVVANAPNLEMKSRALTYMSYAYRDAGDAERARQCLQAAASLQR